MKKKGGNKFQFLAWNGDHGFEQNKRGLLHFEDFILISNGYLNTTCYIDHLVNYIFTAIQDTE